MVPSSTANAVKTFHFKFLKKSFTARSRAIACRAHVKVLVRDEFFDWGAAAWHEFKEKWRARDMQLLRPHEELYSYTDHLGGLKASPNLLT